MTEPASKAADTPPVVYYTAAEVAARLRCSPWWVKEQARRRRVPFAWIARSYRFTEAHIRVIEAQVEVPAVNALPAPPERPELAVPFVGPPPARIALLVARRPARARAAEARNLAA